MWTRMEHPRCAATTARAQYLLMLGALALATVLASLLVATTNKPATRVAGFKDDVSGAPGRIRTYAHGSGGRCSIP